MRYKTTELAVTDKRGIEKYGVFNTICDERNLTKIENITVEQSFFGKLFDYGTVCIQDANGI